MKEQATIDFENNQKIGVVSVPKEFFEREAVFATADEYSKTFFVNVMPKEESHVCLKLEDKQGNLLDEKTLKGVVNVLVDHQMRRDLQKEFGALRQLIVEQAFSSVRK